MPIDDHDQVLEVRKCRGYIFGKFHSLPVYAGEDIHYIDRYHPSVRAEDRLTQAALENAREVYLRIEAGNEKVNNLHCLLLLCSIIFGYGKVRSKKRSDKRWIS